MTSGAVHRRFQGTINSLSESFVKVSRAELQTCCDQFEGLIVKRNALIHAHPITDSDGSQILAYQTNPSKSLHDMKWPNQKSNLRSANSTRRHARRAGYLTVYDDHRESCSIDP